MSTTKTSRIQWKNYGEFSVHYGKNVMHIQPHYKKQWVEQHYDKEWFNPYQYFLYRRAHIGLKVYSDEELSFLSKVKKKRIQQVHEHSLEVVNRFKQKAMNTRLAKYYNKYLGKERASDTTWQESLREIFCSQEIIENAPGDQDPYICTLTIEQLGITKKQMALELVEKRCLPHNFFELTIRDDPRLIKLKKPEGKLDEL